ncbi:MAG: molybdopterin-dependent oxidoreductase [Deltaproteobacteria bacterium]|nr:molybdopterin-dependent oxidoreductase [Deltaproteobacteria bacterium]
MDDLVPLRSASSRRASSRRVSLVPFGLGETKPRHYLEMLRIAWENRGSWRYAWKVLTRGVCDGCALGTSGLHDWTMKSKHLCLVRLNLLRLNTMGALDLRRLSDVALLRTLSSRALRDLGRLPVPLRRRRGEPGFTPISWDDAFRELGDRLRGIDPERFALYMTSRGISNEIYYVAQKAVRALGSPNIDNAARLCHSPSTVAMKRMLGVGASTCSYRDWYGTDVIVFFGSNPANDQPVAMKYLVEAKRQGTRVLAVNALEEPGLARYWVPSSPESALFGTRIVDQFFRVTAGGDLAFVLAVLKRLVATGHVEEGFLRDHTLGWDEFVAALDRLDFNSLVAESGASQGDIEAFAESLGGAQTGVFVWSMGVTQHGHGSETVMAILALGLARAFVGRKKCGLMPIRGHSGVQGGAEMGAYANAFPGGVPIDATAADALERAWGFRPPDRVGLDATAMIDAAASGALDALYSVGGNFLETLPEPARVESALGRVPLRIHQDIVLTSQMLVEPSEVAFILPARTRYEHRGGCTETSTERRVIFSPYIPGHDIGEAREEWSILAEVAKAARPDRAEFLDFADAAAIRAEIARVVPAYRGVERLAKAGDAFQWGDGEFVLSTRRGKQFNSMVQRDRDSLTGADRDHVFMNADDMARLGFETGTAIALSNGVGRFVGRAFAAPIARGNVQMHWPEANALIAAGAVDPAARVPDYNARVRVEALAASERQDA